MIHTAAQYEDRARAMSDEALAWTLRDIRQALDAFDRQPGHEPYVAKLYAERDAYAAEQARRLRPFKMAEGRVRCARYARELRARGDHQTARWVVTEARRLYGRSAK